MKEMISVLKRYLSLTKPGVLFGNVITGVAGFGLASGVAHAFDLSLFAAAIGGMTLVIAAACVLNNVLDQDIDKIMSRTSRRAVASGAVNAQRAWSFGVLLAAAGGSTLALWTNWLVLAIGGGGFIIYVWIYGAFAKRRSLHGTLVGSISGAAPVLAGYVAVRGALDAGAVLVFLALFFWQFPEFYSIAIYRKDEYQAAGVPIITVVKGSAVAKRWILVYATLFVVSAILLTPLGYTGYIYAAATVLMGTYWLVVASRGFLPGADLSDATWARQMFHASLNVILVYSLLLVVGPLLP